MGGSAASGRRPSAFRIDAAPTCPRRIACYRPGSLTGPGRRGGTGRRAGFRFQYSKMWGFASLCPHQTAANADGRARKDYILGKVACSIDGKRVAAGKNVLVRVHLGGRGRMNIYM